MENPVISLNQSSKSARVRSMFAEIAPTYDLLNHALSLNIDKRWRRRVINCVRDRLLGPDAVALDLCCGTAELSLELGALAPTYGVDFCHQMLQIGVKKVRRSALPIELIEGDALNVPFPDSAFDVVTVAFGLRNVDDPEGGLREMHRLLKRGGRCVILEFSHPQLPVFRNLFHFYFTRVLPRIGGAVSGSSFAYQYLPDSVETFPGQRQLAAVMAAVGFSDVRYYNLFGGVACLHIGNKE
jgi:demethylmenaquinone methyltransferase/2-methoxy-6-polyprenyl-1,4-benzoquinol methylase